MHGNPGGGTKWNWVCDPLRAFVCVPVRVARAPVLSPRGNTGTSVYGTTEENYWFSFTPRSRALRSMRSARKEAPLPSLNPPRSLGTARSPCIRAGRQWPRVSEPAVPFGNRDENRANGGAGEGNEMGFRQGLPSTNFDVVSWGSHAGDWHMVAFFDAAETRWWKLTSDLKDL